MEIRLDPIPDIATRRALWHLELQAAPASQRLERLDGRQKDTRDRPHVPVPTNGPFSVVDIPSRAFIFYLCICIMKITITIFLRLVMLLGR